MDLRTLEKKDGLALPLASVCLVLALFLTYKWWNIFLGVCNGSIFSDVPGHIALAMAGDDYGFASLLIRLLSLGGDRVLELGLALSLTVNNVLGLFTLAALIYSLLPGLGFLPALLASLLAHFCGPWIIPGYQTQIYLGAHNGNLYHNMTVLFSRSYIPLCFIFFLRLWKGRSTEIHRGDWLAFMLSLLMCTGFKPNFAFAFIPLLALLLAWDLIASRGRDFKRLFIIGCAVLPAGLMCIGQYLMLYAQGFSQSATELLSQSGEDYGQGESGIALRLLWGRELLDLMVMYLRSLLLPIYALALQLRREPRRRDVGLILAVEAVALLEASVLVETGYRANHGNFDWGGLALYPLIFALGIALLIRLFRRRPRGSVKGLLPSLIGAALLLGHMAVGLYFMHYFAYVDSYFI